jgi:hypothetical protein
VPSAPQEAADHQVDPASRPAKEHFVETLETDSPQPEWIFAEIFAGGAHLTQALRNLGLRCEEPDEVTTGGTDFKSSRPVAQLKRKLRSHHQSGKNLAIHLAPPCGTFSRARDRSTRTRLRSRRFPFGLPDKVSSTRPWNRITRRALQLAHWAATELGAVVTVENPQLSYMWLCAERWLPDTG